MANGRGKGADICRVGGVTGPGGEGSLIKLLSLRAARRRFAAAARQHFDDRPGS